MSKAKQVLEDILIAIVDNKNAVRVDQTTDEMGVLLSVKVSPRDMGLIIGRDGNIINAIRTVVKFIGFRERSRVNIKVIEPEGRVRESNSFEDPLDLKMGKF